MKQLILFYLCFTFLVVHAAIGEGAKQLTPYSTSAGLTSKDNTMSGYLQHDDNSSSQKISMGFLKPSTWSFGSGFPFSEDYRMLVRMKPGETLYYGVRRMKIIDANANKNDLVLTLKYGAGAGNLVQQTTLLRDQTSAYHSLLLTSVNNRPQAGVIATVEKLHNGPNYGGKTNGYDALSYTNNTGAVQDFYLEFTQVGEATLGENAKKSWYDLWDLTVIGTDGLEKTGRLFSKHWSFNAGGPKNLLSKTFAFFPLIPNQVDGSTFYVKKITLAGMRPYGFRFVTNQFGSTSKFGSTFQERRKSQLEQSDYPEYINFVNDPDPEMWPSAADPQFSFSAEAVCDGANPKVLFKSNAGVPSNFMVQIDVNGDGYKPNTADVLIERSFEAGTNILSWNGLDAYGKVVPSGTVINYSYKSYTSPMNFPVFDAEGNASGFKSENVRPVPSTVNDLLYWDDSKLPQDKFQSELNGFNASQGAHLWGATADDGDKITINTWTYGYTFSKDESLTFVYDCSTDLEVMNTVPAKPYYVGDRVTFTVTVKNNGPTNSYTVMVDYPINQNYEFLGASPSVGSYDPATGKWILNTNLPVGASQTMQFEVRALEIGTKSTTALVSSDQRDTNSDNNIASAAFTVYPNPAPLPVAFTSLEAKSHQNGVAIYWSTANEENSDYFSLERSDDGLSFHAIGKVSGKGFTNNSSSYSYIDDKAPGGMVYYRLKQVDTNGNYSYSSIVAVRLKSNSLSLSVIAYPNPGTNYIKLDMTMLAPENYKLAVWSVDGRFIKSMNLTGGFENQLEIGSLTAGVYIFKIQGAELSQTLQVQKL